MHRNVLDTFFSQLNCNKEMSDYDSRFGSPPTTAELLPSRVVLGTQFAACVLLLTAIQPPFVMSRGNVCMQRVLGVAALVVASTLGFSVARTPPHEVFLTFCNTAYRACCA